MALFQFKWLRRFVRRNTKPIPMGQAELWKRRLSLGYALLAWQAFGFVCYMIYTGRADWPKHYGLKSEDDEHLTPAQYYAKLLKIDNGKIIRVSGITKKEELDIEKETTENPSSPSTTFSA